MKITINGVDLSDNLPKCRLLDLDCSKVPTPDLSDIPTPEKYETTLQFLLAKADHFNYSLMSKTEASDFLYRLSNEFVRFYYEPTSDLIKIVLGGS